MPTLDELAAMHATAEQERDARLPPCTDHGLHAPSGIQWGPGGTDDALRREGWDRPRAAPPEHDPTGRAPSDPGAKLDGGKNRIGLMVAGFADALTAVAQVTTFGATKYTPGGWRTVPDGIDRYTDALYRHLLAHGRGEQLDPDSGLPHLAQAAWNCLAVLQLSIDHGVLGVGARRAAHHTPDPSESPS